MITPILDAHGLEHGHHVDLSTKTYDTVLDRLGRVFEAFRLNRFMTFDEFAAEPGHKYRWAAQRGDFWGRG